MQVTSVSDYSVVRDTQWRTAVELRIMETLPTVATLPSTATRYDVVYMDAFCVPLKPLFHVYLFDSTGLDFRIFH